MTGPMIIVVIQTMKIPEASHPVNAEANIRIEAMLQTHPANRWVLFQFSSLAKVQGIFIPTV